VRACGLDSVQVTILEEHVNDAISAIGVIEKHKQAPVNQPRSLLQLLQREIILQRDIKVVTDGWMRRVSVNQPCSGDNCVEMPKRG
jgi:hypothetical protein